jgi:hypothetical protein
LTGGPTTKHGPDKSRSVSGRVFVYDDPSARGEPIEVVAATSASGFRLRLAPGRYYLRATSPQFIIDPKPATPPCGGGLTVVRAAETVHVVVGCAMK